jgi:two-component system sensor histidine kinase PilS (NtrC family)
VTAPDADRLLRRACWVRLGLAELLLVLIPLMPAGTIPGGNTGVLALALLVAVVSSGALLLTGALADPGRLAWMMSLLDSVLVTAVVAATGGPSSIYTFLYVLSVTGASVLLSRPRTLAVAAVASLLYTGLVWSRTVFPITVLLEPPQETTALEVLTIFLNSATFLAVAIVAGGLAERYRATRRELESHRKDLRDLQAFKEVVLRSVGAGLLVVDDAHTVTALNRAAEALLGRSAAEAIGRPWSDLFGEGIPLAEVERTVVEQPGATPRHEASVARADGALVPIRVTFSVLQAGDGRRLGLVAVVEDLSEVREMERRMRQADRLAALGRLAANIAHEIRNPLASMSGAVEVLAGDLATGKERERLTQIVARESARLDRIIGNFLDYARPAPLVLGTVNVAEIAEDVLTLLQHRDLPPGLKIIREFPPSLPWRLDAHQFRQALWNLCLNGVEAMPAGGELRVSAEVRPEGLRVAVSDTGEGIGPGELPHVLEPFYSAKPGGSGLGLALVHRAVEDHGGQIDIRSTPGLGTTVVLTLPPGPPDAGRNRGA